VGDKKRADFAPTITGVIRRLEGLGLVKRSDRPSRRTVRYWSTSQSRYLRYNVSRWPTSRPGCPSLNSSHNTSVGPPLRARRPMKTGVDHDVEGHARYCRWLRDKPLNAFIIVSCAGSSA
jgi:DNA-binding MarR family transcriptional regulator